MSALRQHGDRTSRNAVRFGLRSAAHALHGQLVGQSAWLINLLSRRRSDLVEELFDVGGDLSRAFAAGASAEVRRLTARRRALEEDLGRPVLSANQVVLWHALCLAGVRASVGGYGCLFAHDPPPLQ